jgi:hypothetical protein
LNEPLLRCYTRSMLRLAAPSLLGLILAALACGTGGAGGEDATPAAGDATADAARSDGSDDADGTAVVLSYGQGSVTLDRAYLGYLRASGTITELYFELSTGGEDGCPAETSAVPDQILTVSGFSGAAPAIRTWIDGVRVNFFDFAGTLREEIAPASASAVTIEVLALDREAGTARATADVSFDQGTAVGTLLATHCDSLDIDE